MKNMLLAAALLAAGIAAPAQAGEVFGGVYVHDVETPFNLSGIESGADLQVGWRGERMRFLRVIGSPSPHAFVMVNTEGNTNFGAVGISWKIGDAVYLRPGIGIGVHTGSAHPSLASRRIDFGSRVLFEPEIAVGARITDAVSVEATWVHFSHATLFSDQNPGIDNFGVRLNYRFR